LWVVQRESLLVDHLADHLAVQTVAQREPLWVDCLVVLTAGHLADYLAVQLVDLWVVPKVDPRAGQKADLKAGHWVSPKAY